MILGDINIDTLKDNANKKLITRNLIDYGLKIVNSLSTRNTITSKTLIDLVIANDIASKYIDKEYVFNFPTAASDHDMIYFNYKKPKCIKGQPNISQFRSYLPIP